VRWQRITVSGLKMVRAQRTPGVTDPEEAIGGVRGQPLATALQRGDLMAQGMILCLQRQPGSEARPQSMKQDENDRFHATASLPAEAANRYDFNVVGIISTRAVEEANQGRMLSARLRATATRISADCSGEKSR
jgi:hypothetical protein